MLALTPLPPHHTILPFPSLSGSSTLNARGVFSFSFSIISYFIRRLTRLTGNLFHTTRTRDVLDTSHLQDPTKTILFLSFDANLHVHSFKTTCAVHYSPEI